MLSPSLIYIRVSYCICIYVVQFDSLRYWLCLSQIVPFRIVLRLNCCHVLLYLFYFHVSNISLLVFYTPKLTFCHGYSQVSRESTQLNCSKEPANMNTRTSSCASFFFVGSLTSTSSQCSADVGPHRRL